MDFWDLTKLLVQRWYLTAPALALTAIASVWTLVGVSPNYVATAYVQLAPPISQATQPGEQSLDQRNPWIGLGLYNLANAAILTVQQAGVVESLKASGLSETYTATLNSSSPLVTFEVTGSSAQQAIDTTNELIQRFSTSITDLQVTTYGVNSRDLVVARRIDLGTNVAESDARVKRAVVAVAGLGILLTVAFAVGTDALIARRARKDAGLPTGVGVADLSPAPLVPMPSSPRLSSGRFDNPASHGLLPGPPSLTDLRRTYSDDLRSPSPAPQWHSSSVAEPGGPPVSSPDVLDGDSLAADGSTGLPPFMFAQTDETVVLPLTHRSSRRRESDGEGNQPR